MVIDGEILCKYLEEAAQIRMGCQMMEEAVLGESGEKVGDDVKES